MSLQYAESSQSRAAKSILCSSNIVDEDSAIQRLNHWTNAFIGMLNGSLSIGSRTPKSQVPPFLTPQVMQGGFVSGKLCAGGALLPFEISIVDSLLGQGKSTKNSESARSHTSACVSHVYKIVNVPHECFFTPCYNRVLHGLPHNASIPHLRAILNRYFLSCCGMSHLQSIYRSRMFRIDYPEEAALLTVSWLFHYGEHEKADLLVRNITPYFHLVRFYPLPTENPVKMDLRASILTSKKVSSELERAKRLGAPNFVRRFAVNKIVIEQINPAYDALLSITLATCARVADNDSIMDKTELQQDKRMYLPFQKMTGKVRSAFELVNNRFIEIENSISSLQQTETYVSQKKHESTKTIRRLDPERSNCGFILNAVRKLMASRTGLGRRDYGFIREILIQLKINPKHGLPQIWGPDMDLNSLLKPDCSKEYSNKLWTEQLKQFRHRQQKATRGKEFSYLSSDWGTLLLERLKKKYKLEDQSGVDDVKPLLEPAQKKECDLYKSIRLEQPVPSRAINLIRRLKLGTLPELLQEGLIPSMDVLAEVTDSFVSAAKISALPRRKQKSCGAGIHTDKDEHEAFRALYAASTSAFRKRRSVLLLSYESQVREKEIPWLKVLEQERSDRLKGINGEFMRNQQREVLVSLVKTCISRWPHVIIPNKMISALDMVAQAAGIIFSGKNKFCVKAVPKECVTAESNKYEYYEGSYCNQVDYMGALDNFVRFTPELAADIFMGSFMPIWGTHTQIASKRLRSSVYDAYYRKSKHQSLWDNFERTKREFNIHSADIALKVQGVCESNLLEQQKKKGGHQSWSVSGNGIMIETSMILTSHNYATLFSILEYAKSAFSQEEIQIIAVEGFNKLSSMLLGITEKRNIPRRTMLQTTKNAAYGWRQIVFLLAQMDAEHAKAFFTETVSKQRAAEGCHLQRALTDLRWTWISLQNTKLPEREGTSTAGDACSTGSSVNRKRPWKPFLGWVLDGHHSIWDSAWCDGVKISMGIS